MNLLKALFISLCRAFRNQRPHSETFLIPAYAGLGNFIMATPMILELKRRSPTAKIYLLTWPRYGTDQIFDAPIHQSSERQNSKESIESCSPVAGIFLLDPKASPWRKAVFFLQLRKWKFSTAFIPFDACPAFVWWGFPMAGIPTIAAHSHEGSASGASWIQKVPDISCTVELGSHESDIHLDLLDTYCRSKGIAVPKARSYQTQMASSGSGFLQKSGLEPGGYIVVQISAANARFRTPKLWPRENWAELIRLLEASGEKIVLPGDENEARLVDDFVRQYGFKNVVNIAGRTSVREVSSVIQNAKFLIVHDSGLMHIGNAHGTPLLALYGPTDWNFTMPKAQTSRIFKKNLPCQPCMARMAKTEAQALDDCKIEVKCMREISPDEIFVFVNQFLRPECYI